ncbi:MAG TPA: GNAT family N-acetyltransferase [Croceibacterium sp.]|nr:GNAT family N-acetyltransferase [Croceibacterium sp.]
MMDDVDRIMAVMDAAFDPAFGEAWNRRQVEDSLSIPGTWSLLIGADGAPPPDHTPAAGFSLTRGTLDEEELLLIGVIPELRGRGIGGMLLDRTIAAAHARGATRLFLEMRDGNPAESLYRRHGFVPVGRRRNYYRRGSGCAIDAITFRLESL